MAEKNEEEVETEETAAKGEKKEGSKITETIDHLKKNKNVDGFLTYAKNNTQDTVAYIILIIGLLWMLPQPFNGGIVVGLVVGFYFSKEFIHFIKGFNSYLEENGYAKTIILGGGALALFFLAPGIFIGIAVITALKFLLKAE